MSLASKHFGTAAWTDFSRGLVLEDAAAAMEAHLANGCANCSDIALFLNKLTTVSSRLAAVTPPADAVRLAKALFPVRPIPKRITRILAELIFDSHLAPAPAGIRSTWNVGWQCLYRAGDCFLDLRIEPEPDTSRAAIIGQISNRKVTAAELSDIMVCLKSGRSIVGETRSNRFGEFQLEYEQQQRLQLLVYLDAGSRCIQVPLKKIAPDRPEGTERLPRRQGSGSASGKSD